MRRPYKAYVDCACLSLLQELPFTHTHVNVVFVCVCRKQVHKVLHLVTWICHYQDSTICKRILGICRLAMYCHVCVSECTCVCVCLCVCEWVGYKQDRLIPWLVMSKAYKCVWYGRLNCVCVYSTRAFSHFDNYHKGSEWVFALKCWKAVQEAYYHWRWYATVLFPTSPPQADVGLITPAILPLVLHTKSEGKLDMG